MTEALDRVCADLEGQTEGEFTTVAARRTLKRAEWSQIATVDREALSERVGKLSRQKLRLVLSGLDTGFGR